MPCRASVFVSSGRRSDGSMAGVLRLERRKTSFGFAELSGTAEIGPADRVRRDARCQEPDLVDGIGQEMTLDRHADLGFGSADFQDLRSRYYPRRQFRFRDSRTG